jgi:myo-inositol-1(or 4)-monophosphatase
MTSPAVDGSALLELALQAARAAGTELMAQYGRVAGVVTKSSSTDPVTDADRTAERLLVELIGRARPGDGLLGEEGAARSSDSGITWVIDPLDGTVNYLYQLGNFCVSIAAEDENGALVGVVHAPASGRTFAAVRGAGAVGDDVRLRVNDPVPLERALLATGFAYTPGKRALQGALLARLLPRIRDVRRMGSAALDLCAVANGTVDAYFEEGTNHWDIAAGGLIAREAGAVVTTTQMPTGGPTGCLAAGPALHAALDRELSAVSAG